MYIDTCNGYTGLHTAVPTHVKMALQCMHVLCATRARLQRVPAILSDKVSSSFAAEHTVVSSMTHMLSTSTSCNGQRGHRIMYRTQS